MKRIFITAAALIAALILIGTVAPQGAAAAETTADAVATEAATEATTSNRINVETTPLYHDSTAGKGYIGIEATYPDGFEGTIRVSFESNGEEAGSVDLTSDEFYIGGIWLPTGTYSVSVTIPENDYNLFSSEPSDSTIQAYSYKDSALTVTVTENEGAMAALAAELETKWAAPEEATTEAATEATESSEDAEAAPISMAGMLIGGIIALFIMAMLLALAQFLKRLQEY